MREEGGVIDRVSQGKQTEKEKQRCIGRAARGSRWRERNPESDLRHWMDGPRDEGDVTCGGDFLPSVSVSPSAEVPAPDPYRSSSKGSCSDRRIRPPSLIHAVPRNCE